MTADWSAKPQPVPYADFKDPQRLNPYAYIRNNPMSKPTLYAQGFREGNDKAPTPALCSFLDSRDRISWLSGITPLPETLKEYAPDDLDHIGSNAGGVDACYKQGWRFFGRSLREG